MAFNTLSTAAAHVPAAAGRLAGCVALVTGAAQGIGEATADCLAREGATVWLADIDAARVAAATEGLCLQGLSAEHLQLDVTDPAGWARAMARIDEEAARRGLARGLDILVNNAGIAPVCAFEALGLEQLRRVMQVNAESFLIGLQAALPALRMRAGRRAGGSSVVNVVSLLAQRALPGHLAYGASKAAQLQMAHYAAIELAQAGEAIRVNNVLPAVTETPMVTREIHEWAHAGTMGTRDPEATRQALSARIPMGRLGQPLDVAHAVLFLASSESAFLTGVDLPVAGGRQAV